MNTIRDIKGLCKETIRPKCRRLGKVFFFYKCISVYLYKILTLIHPSLITSPWNVPEGESLFDTGVANIHRRLFRESIVRCYKSVHTVHNNALEMCKAEYACHLRNAKSDTPIAPEEQRRPWLIISMACSSSTTLRPSLCFVLDKVSAFL